MPRDWNRLEQWFEESHEQFHPDVMKMKMTQANVRFARILPHTSYYLLLLLRHYYYYFKKRMKKFCRKEVHGGAGKQWDVVWIHSKKRKGGFSPGQLAKFGRERPMRLT
jgi:hypothetical protein